jgi:NAD-dependent SIR2 family protein deacetylase
MPAIQPYHCLRCAWLWFADRKRTPPGTRPRICPQCKSAVWHTPVVKHGTSAAQKARHQAARVAKRQRHKKGL